MAAVPVIISGVLADKYGRTLQSVTLMGMAQLAGLEIGGGPIYPEAPPGGGNGKPPGIWGPTDPFPTPPIAFPPGWVGGVPPISPAPPDAVIPPPGSPPVVLPGAKPTHPIVPPPAIVVNYPGVGQVLVPLPVQSEPKA